MRFMKQWIVYIIETESGKLYTGITNDLERRFSEHKEGKKGARYFRLSRPQSIVYQEKYTSRSEASKRESEIKRMRRSEKLGLVQQLAKIENP